MNGRTAKMLRRINSNTTPLKRAWNTIPSDLRGSIRENTLNDIEVREAARLQKAQGR